MTALPHYRIVLAYAFCITFKGKGYCGGYYQDKFMALRVGEAVAKNILKDLPYTVHFIEEMRMYSPQDHNSIYSTQDEDAQIKQQTDYFYPELQQAMNK